MGQSFCYISLVFAQIHTHILNFEMITKHIRSPRPEFFHYNSLAFYIVPAHPSAYAVD